MAIIRLSFALTRAHVGRIALFACLTALLCVSAGLLGSFLLGGQMGIPPITIAVVDEDDSMESRMLVDYLEEMQQARALLRFVQTQRAHSREMLDTGEASAAIVIPAGFMAGVMDGSNPPFTVTLDAASPMRAALVRLFAQVYVDMLRTGQKGVYIALDAAREYGSAAQQQEMFLAANMRFLSAMLGRASVLEPRELGPTGDVSVATHYAAAAFVFLTLLGACLFLDIWARAAARPVLLRLRPLGGRRLHTGFCYVAGACVPFGAALLLLALGGAAANAALGLVAGLSLPLIVSLLMLMLCGAGFLAAVSRVFGGGAGGNVFVFLYGLGGLFLSGGIVPPAYMAQPLAALARLTPHYWLTRLLSHSLGGQLDTAALLGSVAFAALLGALAVVSLCRDAKAGETL